MASKQSLSQETDNTATRILTVQNVLGIHARPAAMIVRIANRYSGTELWVEKENERMNAKSIMMLMVLAAGKGAKIKFTATGKQAKQLLDEIEVLFNRKFEEA